MYHSKWLKKIAAVAVSGAIAVSATTAAVAAPIGSGSLALKSAAPADVVDVSWRGRRNTAIALGVLGGLALGGIATRNYYHSPYYYRAPYPYAYAPPPPPRCWVQTGRYRGQGYWSYC